MHFNNPVALNLNTGPQQTFQLDHSVSSILKNNGDILEKKFTIKLITLNFILLKHENQQIYFIMVSWPLRGFDLSFHQNRLL